MINYNSTVFSFLHLLQIILIDIFYWHTLYSKCRLLVHLLQVILVVHNRTIMSAYEIWRSNVSKQIIKKNWVVKVVNFRFHESTSTYPIVLLNQSHVSGNNFRTRIFGSDVEEAEIPDAFPTIRSLVIKATGPESITIS